MTLFWRKLAMAVTGLFLCLFLVVHLSANALLLLPEASAQPLYNGYSEFLRESPVIKVVAYLLYLAILLHVVYAALVTRTNQKARPDHYRARDLRANSTWASQNMGWLGVVLLIFIVIHLVNFWSRIKLGIGAEVGLDAAGRKDVYEVTYSLFQNPYYVAFYSVLMLPLGYHLHHGLRAGFRSLGFHHREGLRRLDRFSTLYAVVVALGFAIIPLVVFLR